MNGTLTVPMVLFAVDAVPNWCLLWLIFCPMNVKVQASALLHHMFPFYDWRTCAVLDNSHTQTLPWMGAHVRVIQKIVLIPESSKRCGCRFYLELSSAATFLYEAHVF